MKTRNSLSSPTFTIYLSRVISKAAEPQNSVDLQYNSPIALVGNVSSLGGKIPRRKHLGLGNNKRHEHDCRNIGLTKNVAIKMYCHL